MSRDTQNAQYAQISRNLPPHVATTTNGVPEGGFGRKDIWETEGGHLVGGGVNLSASGAWGYVNLTMVVRPPTA
ncbi:hypothetical protein B0H65DRAFT_545703 [Neurospora tetraspora]|uniref:Uncharacterized protein n=1 Tax=Neurospora tetraspora TaxID=94610 RepID=A0AAE0JKE0_9PEZI|nr:hypothetical protein B0H65DRAFT_545703 [Neurospora tetraspora]